MNGGSSTVANSSKNTNASPQTTTTTSASSIEQLKSTILRRKSLAATTSTSSNNNYNNIESKEHSDDTNSIQKRWPNQMPPPQQASDNFHSDDYRNVNYDAPNQTAERNCGNSTPSPPPPLLTQKELLELLSSADKWRGANKLSVALLLAQIFEADDDHQSDLESGGRAAAASLNASYHHPHLALSKTLPLPKPSNQRLDLLVEEANVILECTKCEQLFRNLDSFILHKSQQCKPIYAFTSKTKNFSALQANSQSRSLRTQNSGGNHLADSFEDFVQRYFNKIRHEYWQFVSTKAQQQSHLTIDASYSRSSRSRPAVAGATGNTNIAAVAAAFAPQENCLVDMPKPYSSSQTSHASMPAKQFNNSPRKYMKLTSTTIGEDSLNPKVNTNRQTTKAVNNIFAAEQNSMTLKPPNRRSTHTMSNTGQKQLPRAQKSKNTNSRILHASNEKRFPEMSSDLEHIQDLNLNADDSSSSLDYFSAESDGLEFPTYPADKSHINEKSVLSSNISSSLPQLFHHQLPLNELNEEKNATNEALYFYHPGQHTNEHDYCMDGRISQLMAETNEFITSLGQRSHKIEVIAHQDHFLL